MPSATYIDIPRKRIGDMLSHEEFNQIVDALTNSSTDLGVDTYGLNVRTDADVAGTVFTENATITKQATTTALTVNGTTSMNGKARVSSDLTVIGKTELTGDTNIKNGSLSVKRNLTVYGSGESDVLSVTKSTAKIAPGDGSGTITLKGKTDITGDTVVTGNVTLAGPTSISSTLTVTGDTSLQNVTATGNATITGNLTNTGQANLASVNVSNDLDVDGALEAGGNLKTGGDLDVTGNATVGGDASMKNATIDGTATITGDTSIGGAATITGNLSVTGTGTIQDNLTVGGATTTLKGLTATENSQFSKNLTVSGIVTANELAGGAYSKLKTEWGNNITSAITPIANDIGSDTTTGTVKYRIAQLEATSSQIAGISNLTSRVNVLDGGNLPTTINVNGSTGNDTTGDGSSSKPFKTIQAAVDKIPSNGITYKIVCTSGTYGNLSINNSTNSKRKNIHITLPGGSTVSSISIYDANVVLTSGSTSGSITCTGISLFKNSYLDLRCSLANQNNITSFFNVQENSYLVYHHVTGSSTFTMKTDGKFANVINSTMSIEILAGSITLSSGKGFISNASTIYLPATDITNNATTTQEKTNGGQIFES